MKNCDLQTKTYTPLEDFNTKLKSYCYCKVCYPGVTIVIHPWQTHF